MILRLSSEVLEDALLPVPLHVIPIVDQTMANRIVYAIGFGVCDCFVPDVEIKILNSSFGRKIRWFGGDRRTSTRST